MTLIGFQPRLGSMIFVSINLFMLNRVYDVRKFVVYAKNDIICIFFSCLQKKTPLSILKFYTLFVSQHKKKTLMNL